MKLSLRSLALVRLFVDFKETGSPWISASAGKLFLKPIVRGHFSSVGLCCAAGGSNSFAASAISRSWSAVPPASKKSCASFTVRPAMSGNSITFTDCALALTFAATAAACLRPGASLSAMMQTAFAPSNHLAKPSCHLPAPAALQVAVNPFAYQCGNVLFPFGDKHRLARFHCRYEFRQPIRDKFNAFQIPNPFAGRGSGSGLRWRKPFGSSRHTSNQQFAFGVVVGIN